MRRNQYIFHANNWNTKTLTSSPPSLIAMLRNDLLWQILYIYCTEPIDVAPDHPILRPGVTVSIGLDKTTKLKAVFKQYVDFCNSKSKTNSSDSPHISVYDLEFAFSQLLNENETAETSALMKNDRIRVRKCRESERKIEEDRKKMQRNSDRMYFQEMRHLLPESCPTRVADVLLDCRGKLVDNKGRNQRVLSTTVRAHTSMIRKRCPWLIAIIQKARHEAILKFEEDQARSRETPETSASRAAEIENDEDGEIGNADAQAISNSENEEREIGRGEEEVSQAARIEIVDDSDDDRKVNVIIVDDEEDDSNHVVSSARHQIHSSPETDVLTVVLSDHSPEAVKILLEYCYTNRVISLGHNAFVKACKTRPYKTNGPVPPYPITNSSIAKKWPSNGSPTITFSVALAAIKLAEEAGLFRLSFMCEIAAAQLVTKDNIVEALTMSSRQKIISGNDLPRLRKAAMDVLLRRGRRGVSEIGRTSLFKKALDEDRSIIVPSLLQGTMEAVTHWEKSKSNKRDLVDVSFTDIDREDTYRRNMERKRARRGRDNDDENPMDDDRIRKMTVDWASAAAERSLSAMIDHNMDTLKRRVFNKKRSGRSRSSSRSGRDFFGNRDK